MSSFHHQKNSSSHPPLPKMPPNTTTVRLRVGFCDELFRDCIHHSPNTDTSKYYEDARNQLNLWAKAVMVFNNTWLEPTLDIWLRHSSRKLQRDALDILLIGLEELLLYAVKPFYTSDKLPESRALSILKAPQSGIKKIMGSLHFFADRVIAQRKYEATFNDRVCNFKLEMMDRKTEVDIHRDILDRFPKILPSEPLTSVVGAIYEADPEYLRRVRDEVTKNTGNLHRHLADLISFQHCRMLYQRHVKVRHLTMLPRHSGPFQPWSNFHGSYTPSISHLQHVLEIVHGGNDQYPKPPIPNDEGKPGVCPLCLETFPMAELQGEKWKAHVDSDIRPYACPFSSCVEDHRASFSDINEWKKHMHRLHDLDWIRDLHRNPLWKCPICHLVSPREFGTAEIATEDLEIHMEVSHSIGEGNPKRVLAQISRFSTHRPLDICPICKTCYPGVGDVPPLFKSSEAMIEREHWSDDEDSEPNYIWRETLAADNPATKAVEECIAGHLKDMALRSFKYFVEAANRQNTELYWPSSPPHIRPWRERLFREYDYPTHLSGMPCVLLEPEFVEKQRRLLLLEPKKDSKSYPLLSAG